MRTLAVLLTLLIASLAGCIGDDGTDEALNPDTATVPDTLVAPLLPDGTPAPLSVDLVGCDEHLAVLPFPMEAADALPEGFSHVAFDDAGLFATSAAITYTCQMDGETVSELYGAYVVEAPEALQRDDAGLHVLVFGAFTSSQELLDLYGAWGIQAPTVLGDVTVESIPTPAMRAGHTLGTDGDLTVHLYTAVGGELGVQPAGAARVFVVHDDGINIMDVTWTESAQMGPGTAELRLDGGTDPFLLAFGQVNPGLAFHNWGDDYVISYHYVGPADQFTATNEA